MSWNRKSCNWRFVYWNWIEPFDILSFHLVKGSVYFVGQRECCPSSGRDHWQCHIDFDTPLKRCEVIKRCGLPKDTHFLIADHPGRSRSYCRKIYSRVEKAIEFWRDEEFFDLPSDSNDGPAEELATSAGPEVRLAGPSLPYISNI